MYSLDCSYWDHEFESISELLKAVQETGMDPNYEILKDGVNTGETAWDLMEDTI